MTRVISDGARLLLDDAMQTSRNKHEPPYDQPVTEVCKGVETTGNHVDTLRKVAGVVGSACKAIGTAVELSPQAAWAGPPIKALGNVFDVTKGTISGLFGLPARIAEWAKKIFDFDELQIGNRIALTGAHAMEFLAFIASIVGSAIFLTPFFQVPKNILYSISAGFGIARNVRNLNTSGPKLDKAKDKAKKWAQRQYELTVLGNEGPEIFEVKVRYKKKILDEPAVVAAAEKKIQKYQAELKGTEDPDRIATLNKLIEKATQRIANSPDKLDNWPVYINQLETNDVSGFQQQKIQRLFKKYDQKLKKNDCSKEDIAWNEVEQTDDAAIKELFEQSPEQSTEKLAERVKKLRTPGSSPMPSPRTVTRKDNKEAAKKTLKFAKSCIQDTETELTDKGIDDKRRERLRQNLKEYKENQKILENSLRKIEYLSAIEENSIFDFTQRKIQNNADRIDNFSRAHSKSMSGLIADIAKIAIIAIMTVVLVLIPIFPLLTAPVAIIILAGLSMIAHGTGVVKNILGQNIPKPISITGYKYKEQKIEQDEEQDRG